MIREEALAERNGRPLHLELEISRDEYEAMIRPLVESTLDSVSKALQDSGKRPREMDAMLLVGGSTRTPLVFDLLLERIGLEPRQDVHPDLCVALGAGVLASRLAGMTLSACWWTFRPIRSACLIWASAAASPIRTAISRSSGAIRLCR